MPPIQTAKTHKGNAQALTANRLRDGEVVYWAGGAEWSERFDEAAILRTDDEAAAAEAQARADEEARLVVGAYLFEVLEENGAVEPVRTRERIRALGPTVREDLGKQAAGARLSART